MRKLFFIFTVLSFSSLLLAQEAPSVASKKDAASRAYKTVPPNEYRHYETPEVAGLSQQEDKKNQKHSKDIQNVVEKRLTHEEKEKILENLRKTSQEIEKTKQETLAARKASSKTLYDFVEETAQNGVYTEEEVSEIKKFLIISVTGSADSASGFDSKQTINKADIDQNLKALDQIILSYDKLGNVNGVVETLKMKHFLNAVKTKKEVYESALKNTVSSKNK